ncbi:MAG: exonuclease domain-containing protein, partial [Flavobacteriales bacterium]
MEYAIVDIETTGGSPAVSKITEIAIVITNGENVIDSYETLICPEQNIPYNITALTGISNQMVANSPKFYEVAKTILGYLEGRTFVAHNVNFDYGFVRQEFKSLGYTFETEKLCTVRMSRKAFPGLPSYSLGKLSKSLGITLNNAHRAMADTMATVEVFHQIMQVQGNLDIVNSLAEKLGVNKLPNKAGVYYFRDFEGNIIYVGKSISIKKRVQSHLRNYSTKRGLKIIETIEKVEFKLTGNETMALL